MSFKKENIFITIVVVMLLSSLVLPSIIFNSWVGLYPQYSDDEINMMNWIEENVPQDAIIVTEPVLGSMINAYTLRPAVAVHYEEWLEDKSYLRQLLKEFFIANNTIESIYFLKKFIKYYIFNCSIVVVVITPRVSYWAINVHKERWQWAFPDKIIPFPGLKKFNEQPFQLKYNSNECFVFFVSIEDIYYSSL